MTIEEKIQKACEENGVNPKVLTQEEKQMLEKEIIAEENGYATLDGVLSNPAILYRKYKPRD